MCMTEKLIKDATDLYWLAFLITNRRKLAMDLAADALAFDQTPGLCSLKGRSGSPRLDVMAEALAAVDDELAASAHGTEMNQFDLSELPPASWMLDPNTTKTDLERALLDIDIFPRCALLLTVYEGLPLDIATVLMDTNRDLIQKGVALASAELTCHLAKLQGWVPTASAREECHPFLGELHYV